MAVGLVHVADPLCICLRLLGYSLCNININNLPTWDPNGAPERMGKENEIETRQGI